MLLTSSLKSLALALAVTIAAAPFAATYAEAASRKKSNGMKRLGGPQNGNAMRLGGPVDSRSTGNGIYTIPDRFISGRNEDVRQFFLRRDQAGNGN